MAADILPSDETESARYSEGTVSAKDKAGSSQKANERRFEIEEGANKKGITRWVSARY